MMAEDCLYKGRLGLILIEWVLWKAVTSGWTLLTNIGNGM
jgi:hypothetical protein